MRPKLRLVVDKAAHFLRWELPYFTKHFELVSKAAEDVVLFAYGPDLLESAAHRPALRRVAMLFPGFGLNPYHNVEYRRQALEIVESCYDLVFVNPGPLAEAYKPSSKVISSPFSVDTESIPCKRFRKSIDSLIHVSADYPHKDWQRSAEVMRLTRLPYEVFPSRNRQPSSISPLNVVRWRLNRWSKHLGGPQLFRVLPWQYVKHTAVVRKYQQYDGFVHIAAEDPTRRNVDGKYTATLLEAGITGAILFWHDTLGLGNDLETVFDMPLVPQQAAADIVDIRHYLDVEQHSRLTREEILDRYDAERSVDFRCSKIKELL